MAPLYRLPRRFIPIYEQARAQARADRLINPNLRTAHLEDLAQRRAERDRQAKIARTMAWAREYTAMRKAVIAQSRSQGAA